MSKSKNWVYPKIYFTQKPYREIGFTTKNYFTPNRFHPKNWFTQKYILPKNTVLYIFHFTPNPLGGKIEQNFGFGGKIEFQKLFRKKIVFQWKKVVFFKKKVVLLQKMLNFVWKLAKNRFLDLWKGQNASKNSTRFENTLKKLGKNYERWNWGWGKIMKSR